jgi:hypothetical protein
VGAGRRLAWDAALGRARERAVLEAAGGAAALLAAPEGRAGTALAAASPDPVAGAGGAAVPAGAVDRAAAAVALIAQGDRFRLEVSAGPGLRFALSAGTGGVEIQARAAPPLERLARADLHAVAVALRRRGVPLARATVSLGGPASGTERRRVDLPPGGR